MTGTAGLAYFLLAAGARCGSPHLLSLAHEAGAGLLRLAQPMVGGRGLSWTKAIGGFDVPWSHWCNGAAGVGYSLVALAKVLGSRDAEVAARRAANSIRLAEFFRSCGQCHGLAGDGEYLLHAGRELERPELVGGARRIAGLLNSLQFAGPPAWTWPIEGEGRPVPAYMVGYTGIHSFLLRLAHPQLRTPLMLQLEPAGRP